MSDGGFAVMKAPEVGLACSALYKDGHSYQGTIDVVEEDRCLIRYVYNAWNVYFEISISEN